MCTEGQTTEALFVCRTGKCRRLLSALGRTIRVGCGSDASSSRRRPAGSYLQTTKMHRRLETLCIFVCRLECESSSCESFRRSLQSATLQDRRRTCESKTPRRSSNESHVHYRHYAPIIAELRSGLLFRCNVPVAVGESSRRYSGAFCSSSLSRRLTLTLQTTRYGVEGFLRRMEHY